jgi:hypothetical protein
MKTLLQRPGFGSFLLAQLAFNDSANKLTLIRWVDSPILLPPGLALRLVDLETFKERPSAQRGLVALRGGNVVTDCLAVRCADKGEELVLLTRSLSRETLRRALASRAVPNLWMPCTVVHVAQLPVLGSGKPDLAACAKLAEGAPAAP